jgi:uncharacterized protein (DUF1778 family)
MKKTRKTKTNGSGVKEEYLELRLYAAEKEAFKDAANLFGMALSQWVRTNLRAVAQKQLQEAGKPVAFIQ